MSSPTVNMPAPVDGAALAAQQGQNNLEAAIATSLLNQTNEITPYGTVSYTRNNAGYGNTPTQQQGPSSYQQNRGQLETQPDRIYGDPEKGDIYPEQYQRPDGAVSPYRQSTPSSTYDPITGQDTSARPSGYNADGSFQIGGIDVPSFTRTVTLSPAQQAKLDAQNRIQGQTADIAEGQLGRVGEALGQGINYENLPDMVSNISGGQIQGFNPNAGQVQGQLRQFDPLGGINNRNLQGAGVQGTQGGINQGGLSNIDPQAVQNQLSGNLQGVGLQGSQRGINQAGLFGINPQAVQNQLGGNLQGANVQGVQGQLEGDLQGVTVNQAQGINTGGLQDVRDDFGLQGNELERATFERGRSLLEPQFGRAMRDAEVRLSERGLPLGSEAGSEILGGVQTNQNRALNELALASVAAGRGEQARLFGQDMALRGQQFGERATGTQLGNQAIGQNFSQDTGLRGQQFGEQQARASLFNQAGQQRFGQETALRGQQFGEGQARANLFNQAGQQAFGQNTAARNQLVNERMNQANLANQANQQDYAQQTGLRGQQFGEQQARASLFNQAGQQAFGQNAAQRNQLVNERMGQAALSNQANQQRFAQQTGLRGQQFGERQAEAAFANQARGQAFTQGAAGAEFANNAQAQRFAQSQQANALNNQLQQQAYQQAAGNAQLQNTARQNALQEQIYDRNMPLNDLAALMGQSGGIQLPQFAQSPNVAVQSGDLVGASLAANQQAIDVAKARQQASGGFMGGLMELGGALGSAAIMSDIKSKTNIKRIGKYKGHNLYSYNYIDRVGDWIGVMAQEIEKVIPEAVQEINGMKHVNYGAI